MHLFSHQNDNEQHFDMLKLKQRSNGLIIIETRNQKQI